MKTRPDELEEIERQAKVRRRANEQGSILVPAWLALQLVEDLKLLQRIELARWRRKRKEGRPWRK